jgi:hypothetical protein
MLQLTEHHLYRIGLWTIGYAVQERIRTFSYNLFDNVLPMRPRIVHNNKLTTMLVVNVLNDEIPHPFTIHTAFGVQFPSYHTTGGGCYNKSVYLRNTMLLLVLVTQRFPKRHLE